MIALLSTRITTVSKWATRTKTLNGQASFDATFFIV
jgi:hypothetical protein